MYKSLLLFFSLGFMTLTAFAATPPDSEVLDQARRLQMEFRQGNLEVAKPLVKMLEEAVSRSPNNAQLWEMLGHALMSLQGSMYAGPPDMAKLLEVGERARDAYARSLAIRPNDRLTRSSHGMATMIASLLRRGPGVDRRNERGGSRIPELQGRPVDASLHHHSPSAWHARQQRRHRRSSLPARHRSRRPSGRRDPCVARRRARGDGRSERSAQRVHPGLRRLGLRRRAGEAAARRPRRARSLRRIRQGTSRHGLGCVMCHAPGSDN